MAFRNQFLLAEVLIVELEPPLYPMRNGVRISTL
jgi:hypothetical protein